MCGVTYNESNRQWGGPEGVNMGQNSSWKIKRREKSALEAQF